jgi:hypothetical protein
MARRPGHSSGASSSLLLAVITVIVASVTVYNDFVNPLYFLPGDDNATAADALQLPESFNTRWNLLFADVLLITIPPVMFIFFQRGRLGMTTGAVKVDEPRDHRCQPSSTSLPAPDGVAVIVVGLSA